MFVSMDTESLRQYSISFIINSLKKLGTESSSDKTGEIKVIQIRNSVVSLCRKHEPI